VAGAADEPRDDAGNVAVDFGVARYTADGQPDTTFAPGGKLVTSFPELSSVEPLAQGLQADGKLVVAGNAQRLREGGGDQILMLARYACQ
jgi:hypothetical protein